MRPAVGLNGCYDDNGHGWYYAFGQPGCLFDSDPSGPYTTRKQAYEAARDVAEELPAWSTLKRRGVV